MAVRRATQNDFDAVTWGSDGSTVTLQCSAPVIADIAAPTIAWYKGSSPAQETAEETTADGVFGSKLPVVVSSSTDGASYKCVATWSELNGGSDLTSDVTEIKMNKMTATTAYAIKAAGESQDFVCTATAVSTVDIKWRKQTGVTDGNPVYEDLTSKATQAAYNTGDNTRTTTLSLTSLANSDSSDSIECYDATVGITATQELNVVEISGIAATGCEANGGAIFTCIVSVFDKTPTVEWYKKATVSGQADTQIADGATNPESGKFLLTLSNVQMSQDGDYYCKAVYNEDGSGDQSFESSAAALYVRGRFGDVLSLENERPRSSLEFDSTTTSPVYVHSGEDVTLSCVMKVQNDNGAPTGVKWYKGETEITASDPITITTGSYDTSANTLTSTFKDGGTDKLDGGDYKCEYAFPAGPTATLP
eukprot:sb/3465026/